MFLAGLRIIEENLTKDIEEIVTRSWHERLFTLPWKPWKRYKTVLRMVADMESIYLLNGDTLICHPTLAQQIREYASKQ